MDPRPRQANSESLLIYDARCRLCVTAKEAIEQREEGLGVRFVPYQSEEAVRCLGNEYRPGRPDVAFLVDRNGEIHRGLDAFIPMLPGLRGGRFFLGLLRLPLGRQLGKLLYRVVARYRYRWFGEVPTHDRG
ncbi:MAG: DUF393 domain-containing protein [Nitrospira sp.]|nr:DUF393 domain-containing protein [Nitrospira sp.]MCZ6781080.1 DUF393 domain-containing protein [Nitrospirota bacterium]MEC4668350.1 DUF393 domain-containing protein [Nitrospirota bacterium]MEC4687248.1 DUF393 domain-containing protein [Nitrospirota bacterium]